MYPSPCSVEYNSNSRDKNEQLKQQKYNKNNNDISIVLKKFDRYKIDEKSNNNTYSDISQLSEEIKIVGWFSFPSSLGYPSESKRKRIMNTYAKYSKDPKNKQQYSYYNNRHNLGYVSNNC